MANISQINGLQITAQSASYAATASFVIGGVSINTGSLVTTSSFNAYTGSNTSQFAGTASFASTVPASGVIGLNLSQIATGSVTASVSPTQFTVTSGSSTELVVRGTGVTIGNAITDTHFITGSARITGSLDITGSITATQIGVGAAPSSSVVLDVRSQTSTDVPFRIRNSTNATNLLNITAAGLASFTSPNSPGGNNTTIPLITLNQGLSSFGNSSVMFRLTETSINNSFAIELYKRSGYSETRFLAGGLGNGVNTEQSFMTVIGTNTSGGGSITFDRGVGIGATPSSSVSLDIRATATATDPAFRVRNNANTQNLMSLTSNGFGISFNASGYNIIAGSSNNLSVGDFSGGNYTINHYSATDTAYIQQNSLSYYETISTSYTNATENLKSATTIGKIAYTGASTQNKVNFVNSTTYWGTGGVYSAGFHWYRSGVSGDPTVTRIASSCTDANRQMWLTPDNSLILLTAPSALAYTASITGFQMYSSTGSISSNPRPHFRTGNGTTVWLGDESRLFNVTASRTIISSSQSTASGSSLTVYGSGSTQPVFTVQGSQGELFSVTDSLSGSLFSVNDISGLPILEVFSDNTTLIGNYLDPMLITTAKVTQTNSGSFVMYSLPTASYDTAFFEYSVKSGSNARAGTIMAIQSGSAVNFTETTTTDFGNTSAISFTVVVTGSNMALTGSSTSGAWTIKTIVRGL